MTDRISLILYNANVMTLDPLRPRAQAVAIAGQHIAALGDNAKVLKLRTSGSQAVDCRGLALVPGLNDAHCHLLATATSLLSIDCASAEINSLERLFISVQQVTRNLAPGSWVRGYGLDPTHLAEGRYPTLWELDRIAPEHPVRLEHSSGHAAVMNTRALEAAGIGDQTPDPIDGVIDRDMATGEATGLLLEMSGFLREKLGITRTKEELELGIRLLSKKLLGHGITSVQDAGPRNGLEQWHTFQSLQREKIFGPRITMMAGIGKLGEFADSGLQWGGGDERLRLGHAKIMLTETTGQLHPSPEDLQSLAAGALAKGFPFAIHAVEEAAIKAVLDLPQLGCSPGKVAPYAEDPGLSDISPSPGPRNRIEHCAECPPRLMGRLARSGATVVTQPGFLYWRGDDYLRNVPGDILPHLYNAPEMSRRHIPMAFGSDAPVIDPSPWPGIFSAVTSSTRSGDVIPRDQPAPNPERQLRSGMSLVKALAAYTQMGAFVESREHEKGAISEGMLADLALLDTEMSDRNLEQVKDAHSLLTIVGGQVKWLNGVVL